MSASYHFHASPPSLLTSSTILIVLFSRPLHLSTHQQDKPTSPATSSTGDDSGFANFGSSPSFSSFKKKIKHDASDNTGGNDAWGDAAGGGSQGFSTAQTSGNGSGADAWGNSYTGDTKSSTTAALTEVDIWGAEPAASTSTNQPVQTSSSACDDEPSEADKARDIEVGTSNESDATTSKTPEVIRHATVAADVWGDTADFVVPASRISTGLEPSSIWANPPTGMLETPQIVTMNNAWRDSSDGQTFNGISSDTTNKDEGWETSTSASATDNSQSYGYGNSFSNDVRGRGRGRGRGGRGRGRGSDRFSGDSREGSYDDAARPQRGGGGGGAGNQMYQAPDSGWQARNQRAHPYFISQLSRQVSHPGNGYQGGNASYDYIPQQSPPAPFQASLSGPSYPSVTEYGTQAYAPPEAWSTIASKANQIPRQFPNGDLTPTAPSVPQASSNGVGQDSDINAFGGNTIAAAGPTDNTCSNSIWD